MFDESSSHYSVILVQNFPSCGNVARVFRKRTPGFLRIPTLTRAMVINPIVVLYYILDSVLSNGSAGRSFQTASDSWLR
jgi:hypothetical protein